MNTNNTFSRAWPLLLGWLLGLLIALALGLGTRAGAQTAPNQIPGLTLWLEQGTGLYQDAAMTTPVTASGQTVEAWADQSGHGNNFTQATSANAPTLDAAGNPLFTAANDQTLTLASASSASLASLQTGAFTLMWALKGTATSPNYYGIFSKGTGAQRMSFFAWNDGFFRRLDQASYQIEAGAPTSGSTSFVYSQPSISPANPVSTIILTYTFQPTGANVGVETWRVNGSPVAVRSGAVSAVDTADPWVIGNAYSADYFQGEIIQMVAYNSALTPALLTGLEKYMAAQSRVTLPSRSAACQVVYEGDSITYGLTASDIYHNYPSDVMANEPNYSTINFSLPSETLATILSNDTVRDAPAGSSAPESILVIFAGTNDIYSSASAATTYANLQSYCTAMRPYFSKIIVLTMLPRNNYESSRQTYNADIRAGFAAGTLACDAVVDVGNDPNMGQSGQEALAAGYFAGDATHPSNLGYTVLAAYVQPILKAFLPPLPVRCHARVGSRSGQNQ